VSTRSGISSGTRAQLDEALCPTGPDKVLQPDRTEGPIFPGTEFVAEGLRWSKTPGNGVAGGLEID